MNRLHTYYREYIVKAMMDRFGYSNALQVPRITKLVINIGLGEALDNPKALDSSVETMTAITGQKPVITRARKSIANFKLREGRAIGVKVDLRGERMWAMLDRLINIALPRTRDFRGISSTAFDGRGNYTLGLREQLIFPEIAFDKVDAVRGMEITIVTSAATDQEGREILRLLGMPFRDVELAMPRFK
jgi:large subunit ribosomal protein L5